MSDLHAAITEHVSPEHWTIAIVDGSPHLQVSMDGVVEWVRNHPSGPAKAYWALSTCLEWPQLEDLFTRLIGPEVSTDA